MSVKLQNGPSRTGNPSGKGRGNLPSSNKAIRIIVLVFGLFVFLPFCGQAQDKVYKFFDMQLKYPSQGCLIYGAEKNSDILLGDSGSFILSAIFTDGSEELMKVEIVPKVALALFSELYEETDEFLGIIASMTMGGIESSPVFSHIRETYSKNEDKYAYIDYEGRYYRNKRTSSSAYYERIKGRVLVRMFGQYVLTFTMQVPDTNNFNTLQKIANSVTYSY